MQSNRARIAIVGVALVVVVVLFVVLSGGDDEGSSTTATTSEATTAGGTNQRAGEGQAAAGQEPTITIKDAEPVGGVTEISATSGDEVRFRVVSDTAGEVHVHGYEIEKEISPGKPLEMSFPADLEGAFEIELHIAAGGEAELAELQVNPG